MKKVSRSEKKNIKILRYLGIFFLLLSVLTLITGRQVNKLVSDLFTTIAFQDGGAIPAEEETDRKSYESSFSSIRKSPEESEQTSSGKIIPLYVIYSIVFAAIGGICLMSSFILNRKKKKAGSKDRNPGIPVSNSPAFDPGGLYTTTTPLSGSGYGVSEEVSVTSPLNNDFYFEVVEELKFFGSDEIIQ